MKVNLRDYFRPQRRSIVKLGVVSMVSAQLEALSLVLVVPLAQAIADGEETAGGRIGPASVELTVDQLILVSFGAILLAALSNALFAYLRADVQATFEREARDELLELFMNASWPTQQAVRGGKLLQLSGYTNKASGILGSLIGGIRALLSVLTFLALSFVIDPRSAAAIVLTGVVLSLALRPLVRRIRDANARISTVNIEYSQEINDSSGNARDLRVFGASELALDALRRLSADLAAERRRSSVLGGLMGPAYQYTGLLLILTAIILASSSQSVDIRALGAISLLLLRSLSYAQQLQTTYRSVIESTPFLERLEEAHAEYRAGQLPTGGSTLESVQNLRLESVSYSYDGESDALSELDLTLRAGEVIGVVGPSGSGKSTLLQILLRLREPTSGRLLVNGTPATDYSLSSWYERVTMVPQQTHLFHASVADNIAMFRDVDRAEIERAAQAAGVHDVITTLPDGYDTDVGPAFRDLSGGQIQRIGIARALARGASVLVLDEPTSSLDVHSEGRIQETLMALQGEVTLVIIAHRLSTLSICDRLVVLHEGHLEAAGPLQEVFDTNEFFRTALDAGILDLQATPTGE